MGLHEAAKRTASHRDAIIILANNKSLYNTPAMLIDMQADVDALTIAHAALMEKIEAA
jgi:hypothetical protein